MSDGELYAKVSNLELTRQLAELQKKYDKAIEFIKRVERTPLLYTTVDAQALTLLIEIGEADD